MNQKADAFEVAPACRARSVRRTPTQWTSGTFQPVTHWKLWTEAGGRERFEVRHAEAQGMVTSPSTVSL